MVKLKKKDIDTCRAIKKIQKQRDDLYIKMEALQDKCLHPTLLGRHDSNTGNYDPSDDCYWTDFYCSTCGKRWSVDGSDHKTAKTYIKHNESFKYELLSKEELKSKIVIMPKSKYDY